MCLVAEGEGRGAVNSLVVSLGTGTLEGRIDFVMVSSSPKPTARGARKFRIAGKRVCCPSNREPCLRIYVFALLSSASLF